MKQRIVYFCDWLPPDFGAVGQYSLAFARRHAERGNEVALFGLSSTGDSQAREDAGSGRLTIHRVRASKYDRSALARRLVWTLATNLKLLWRARRELRQADTVIFTGSPPFLVHLLAPLNLLLGKNLVYRITDFYPECIVAARPQLGVWLAPLLALTNFWRRRVATLEVIGEDQKTRLLEYGISPEKINVVRDDSPVRFTGDELHRSPLCPKVDGPVLLYSGNLGVVHDWQTFVDGYLLHRARSTRPVTLWLNASGTGADQLEEALKQKGAPVHRSTLVPLADLAGVLVGVDAHLITLKDAFVGYVLPSKVYACIASQRPILYVGSKRSDVYELLQRGLPAGTFFHAEVGDAQKVAASLDEIAVLSRHA